jgi:enoyl-CoA hydratase/carnithine racemase
MNPADPGQVRIERDDTIATVVLDRPAKLNALTRPMWRALGAAFESLSSDDTVRVVIVRGAGERAFSPGNDIKEFETERANKAQAIAYGHDMHHTAHQIAACRHPVVAQIHGICVGGGLEIAALADIRICGTSSRFGAPIKNLGLVMAYDEMKPLVDLVGRSIALEILLEGRIMDAQEAQAKGLVSRVVPDDQVAAETLATARRIAEGAPLVARWHKQFARRLMDPSPLTAAERDVCFDCFDTEDFRSGYAAFVAKNAPVFKGR